MAHTLEETYALAALATKLRSACDARTLTNNPSPVIVQNVEDAAAALGGSTGPADAVVTNGDPVTVFDGSKFDLPPIPGAHSILVLDGELLGVSLLLDALDALISNGGNVTVKNSAGTVTKTGVATVAAGAVTGVALAATEAVVSNAGAVTIQNSAGAAVAGTHAATVAAGVVSNVKLAATIAPVANGLATIPLQNSAGAAKGTVTATVAAGVVSNVRPPATMALIASGDALAVPVTGTYTTTATVTVAGGVVTGIVLS